VLGQLSAAFSGGKIFRGVQLSENAIWHAGNLEGSGNVTLIASPMAHLRCSSCLVPPAREPNPKRVLGRVRLASTQALLHWSCEPCAIDAGSPVIHVTSTSEKVTIPGSEQIK
jgi:hypothetical protein